MITTTFNLMNMNKIEPLDDQSVFETVIPPLQRVKDFSDEGFEEFIAEWAVACAKTKYKDVYRIGGAGDKGRDVIAEYENGTFDYYQCKNILHNCNRVNIGLSSASFVILFIIKIFQCL